MNEGELQALAGLRQRSREQYEAAQGQRGGTAPTTPEPVTDFDAGARESAPTPVTEAEFLLRVLAEHHTAPPYEQ